MNSMDEFALKQIVLYLDGKNLELKTVDPGNDHERDELDKKG